MLLSGSGTAAVEAMLTSVVPVGGRVLVVANGVYGERMSQIARAHRIDHTSIDGTWTEAIDLPAVARELERGRYSHVAVVHHETTSGRLNDISAVAALAGSNGARLLIDGVSSFGAEALEFDAWNVDACAATANKCLHGAPGTAFVVVRRAALATPHAATPPPARTVYLDLATYLAAQDGHGTPFTQSVQTFYALDAALDEILEAGGWRARRALLRGRMARVRAALDALGVRALLPADESSCVLASFTLPDGHAYDALHDELKRAGFVIYAGQGALSGVSFRISAMGDIGDDDLRRLVEALDCAFGA